MEGWICWLPPWSNSPPSSMSGPRTPKTGGPNGTATESSMANPVGESGRTIYGPRSWKNRRGALAGNVVRSTPPVPATAFVTGVQRIGGARLVALIGT